MESERQVVLVEDSIPLEGIEDRASDVIRIFGGEIQGSTSDSIRFVLPERQGIAAAGGIACTLSWAAGGAGEGTVKLAAERDVQAPKLQRAALLTVGSIGALLWLLWPFYPALGALSWIGAILAFATYFLALRRSRGGVMSSLLHQIADVQRDVAGVE